MSTAGAPGGTGLLGPGLGSYRWVKTRVGTWIGLIWAIAVALVVMVWAGGYVVTELVRKQRLGAASAAVSIQVRGMQTDIERALGRADDALKQVSLAYVADASGAETLLNQRVIDAASVPVVVLNAKGNQSIEAGGSSGRPGAPLPEDFAAHQRADSGGALLSKAARAASTGVWFVQLSRRLNRADGSFGGMVMTSVDLKQMARHVSHSTLLPGSDTVLMQRNGAVLVRNRDGSTGFGGDLKDAPLLNAVNAGQTDAAITGADGLARRYQQQPIEGFPLVLLHGVLPQALDLSGRPARVLFVGQMAAWTLLILLSAVALTRTMKTADSANARRRRAETALRDSEVRLQLAMIGGGVGNWEINFPEKSMFVSKQLHTMLGYVSDGRLLPLPEWQSFIHAHDLDRATQALTETHAGTKDDYLLEVRLRTKDDRFCWLALQGKVSRDRAGRVVQVAGLARDISDLKFTSEQVEDRNAQLATIFQLSPDAFVSFDAQHRVKYVNPAFTRMTGWQIGEVEGLAEAVFSERLDQLCIPARPFPGVAALRAQSDNTESLRSELIELSQSPRRLLRVSLRISAADSMSQILYLRDVTHEALTDEMKTEFLSTAAHELRTPLTGILGFAEIMSTETLRQEKQTEFANIIWRQARNLAGILDELLDLTRIESLAGKDFVFEPVDLEALVKAIVDDFSLPEGRLPPEVSLPTVFCKADRSKLRQVILNVLSNAYKYSKPGDAVAITLASPPQAQAAAEKTVTLVIRDEGIGMTSAQLERLFERFYRADDSGAVPGTGLGMTIVKEIMAALGGEVNVSSLAGQGTTVSLVLPRARGTGQSANPGPVHTTPALPRG